MRCAKIVSFTFVLWGISFAHLLATTQFINQLDAARTDAAFAAIETLKFRLQKEGQGVNKDVLADALLQYALTGRLPHDAETKPELNGITNGGGFSTTGFANKYQKTLIAEAIIVANLYRKKEYEAFRNLKKTIINPALAEPIPKHQQHAGLGYILYLMAEKGKDSDVVEKILNWFLGKHNLEQKKVSEFLDTFVSESGEAINFEQLRKQTREKYGRRESMLFVNLLKEGLEGRRAVMKPEEEEEEVEDDDPFM